MAYHSRQISAYDLCIWYPPCGCPSHCNPHMAALHPHGSSLIVQMSAHYGVVSAGLGGQAAAALIWGGPESCCGAEPGDTRAMLSIATCRLQVDWNDSLRALSLACQRRPSSDSWAAVWAAVPLTRTGWHSSPRPSSCADTVHASFHLSNVDTV